MPLRTPVPCAHIGCPALTSGRYCEEHINDKKEEQKTFRKELPPRTRSPIYATAQWQRLRMMVLRKDPICAADGCRRFAIEVDHIIPLAKGGSPFGMDNLQGLCKPCHARKTLSEQRQDREETRKRK